MNLLEKKVVFVSDQRLDLNGRYIKCAAGLKDAGAKIDTLLIGEKPHPNNSNFKHISRPNWGNCKLCSALSYRILKRRVLKFLARQQYDIYHIMDYVSLDIIASAKKYIGGKILFDACEIFTETAYSTPVLKKYVQKIFDRNSRQIDAVITPSNYLKDYYAKICPNWPAAQIISNTPNHQLTQAYDGRLHQALNLDLSEKILLYHGAFSISRGLENLISTADAIPIGYTLVFMGYGVLEEELKYRASKVNKKANRQVVKFMDAVRNKDLLLWIAGACYGLIPYESGPLNHTYCTPNKLYEYPAANIPVLTTDLQALSDIINKYKFGAIIGNEMTGNNLANYLQNSTPEIYEKQVAMAKEFAKAHNWKTQQEKLIETYQLL